MSSTGKKQLLVIDDEQEILRLITLFLKNEEQLQVTTINNSMEALQYLSININKFDLIISDINMPELTGVNLLKKLRRLGLSTKWIFYTAYPDFRTELLGDLDLNVLAYEEKPLRKKHFVQKIRKYLDIS